MNNSILAPWERLRNEFNEILKHLGIRTSEQLATALDVHKITALKYMRGGYDYRSLAAIRGMLLAKRLSEGVDPKAALERYRKGELPSGTGFNTGEDVNTRTIYWAEDDCENNGMKFYE